MKNRKFVIERMVWRQAPTTQEDNHYEVIDKWNVFLKQDWQDGAEPEEIQIGEAIQWLQGNGQMVIGQMCIQFDKHQMRENKHKFTY